MPYGEIRVDTITFTNGGVDTSISVSGLANSTTGNLTVTGTVSGVTANFVSGSFSTRVSGLTVAGTTGTFTSLTGTTITGTTVTATSGVVASGTATNPSLSIIGDANTGLYSPGADQVAISTNGAGRLFVDASGNVDFNAAGLKVTTGRNLSATAANSNISLFGGDITTNTGANIELYGGSHATLANLMILDADEHRFRSAAGSGERARIDSSGRLLVGTSSAVATFNYAGADRTPRFQVVGDDINNGAASIVRTGTAPSLFFGAGASGTNVTSSSTLARIVFSGFHTDKYYTGAEILSLADGTPGISDMPSSLIFSTSADGASSPTERMRIDSSGRVGIGTSPISPLDVAGTIGFNTGNTTAGRQATYALGVGDIGTVGQKARIAFEGTGANGWLTNITFSNFTGDFFNAALQERARIDSSGRLLVGTSSAYTVQGFNRSHYFAPIAGENNNQMVVAGINTGTPAIFFTRTRGGTPTTYTVVQDGDSLGVIDFYGADGSAYSSSAARIQAFVDGTPGLNDMPGRLVFFTTADGASSSTERMRINNAGNVGIGTTGPATEALLDVNGAIRARAVAADTVNSSANIYALSGVGGTLSSLLWRFVTNANDVSAGTERMRIDSSGRMLVGTSSARTAFYGTNITGNLLQVEKVDNAGATFVANFNDASARGFIVLAKSRGATLGSNTVVQSGDNVGEIAFAGADGTQPINLALINAFVDGTPGTNDMPGRLVFSTTADGASSPTERMRITNAGNVGISVINPSARLHVNGANATNNFLVTAGGTGFAVYNDDSTGEVRLAAIDTAATNTKFLTFYTNPSGSSSGTERVRIDSSGRLLVGTSSAYTVQGFNRSHYFAPIAGENNNQMVVAGINTGTPAIFFTRTRGGTPTTYTVVQDGDSLGVIDFYGADGSAYSSSAARIQAFVDGTPGLNDMPGRLVFFTTADGASSSTERMRIDSSGRLLIGITTPYGIPSGDGALRSPGLQRAASTFADSTISATLFSSTGTTGGATLSLARSNSDTVGNHAVAADGNIMGAIYFSASDGTNQIRGAQILTAVDGTPGTNDMPGRLVFGTTADGASSPTERMRINNAGTIFFGNGETNASPANALVAATGGSGTNITGATITVQGGRGTGTGAGGPIVFSTAAAGTTGTSSNPATERARIDSSGRLLIGTSTARANFFNSTLTGDFQVESVGNGLISVVRNSADAFAGGLVIGKTRGSSAGSNVVIQSGDGLGVVSFQGSDGTDFVEGARIQAVVDGAPGANDLPCRLEFSTTADGASSPTERCRITSNGSLLYGTAGATIEVTTGSTVGMYYNNSGNQLVLARNGGGSLVLQRHSSDGTIQAFYRDNTLVGTISVTTTATAYNTSSDYRLKENVVPLTGAIDRLNQLQVHRFNFIGDPDKTVDGFIAHEAQAVVPECVTGTKDEVDNDGNPVYQGIDQSKIVPLLTAALQEAIAKIKTLEAKVAALEAK